MRATWTRWQADDSDDQSLTPFFSGLPIAVALNLPLWALVALPLWEWLG